MEFFLFRAVCLNCQKRPLIQEISQMPRDFKGVMVSSTFTDLKEHRAALINIIDRSGFKAVVMEHDSAKSDVDVLDSSLRMVGDAAVYIGIIAKKLGQIPKCPTRNPRNVSITELEFIEAGRLGRPILLFLMGDGHPVLESQIELKPGNRKKLNAFRERAKKMGPDSEVHRVYAEFNSLDEFKEKAAKALSDLRLAFHATPSAHAAGKETTQPVDKKHKEYAELYQAILKEELGYIRMLGLPGVESIKVNLNNDTFVPLRLSDSHENVGRVSKESDLLGREHILYPDAIMKQAFHDRRGHRMLLVIGDPGAGKTTLLKYYALCSLEDYTRLGFSAPVNVFYLPLRDLVRDKEGRCTEKLPGILAGWSEKHHQPIDAEVFTDWLNYDSSLVLLDGLDEISNTDERKEVCRWIDNAFSGFSKAFFVVTSRETGYRKDEGIELASDYERADVQDFTADQQERFLRNWFTAAFLKEPCEKEVDEERWQEKQKKEAEKRTTTIVAHLKVEKNKGLRQLAAIPMILQIMAILWKEREYMPENRVELYDAALNYLLEFRDKRRDIKPLLSATHARQVLGPVSLWMQDTLKKDEAARGDMHCEMQEWLDTLDTPPTAEAFCDYLVKRAGLLVETGGKEYLFRHKSFREYLAGVQLKEDRPYAHINTLVAHFGEDWWEEPLRFFIASVDAKVFDAFMEKLFNSPQSDEMTQKQQLLLQTIIEEAKGKKVDALCNKLLEPATTASRQRVILDCLKAIPKPAALDVLLEFSERKLAGDNRDIINRTEEVILALGGLQLASKPETSVSGKPASFRNPNEQGAEYILIPGGSYIYSVTEKEEHVEDLYFAKYLVTNRLYRLFIASIRPKSSSMILPLFDVSLKTIAKNNSWGEDFSTYLEKGKRDFATLFRSEYDEDRKFGGEDQPVVGITWYAAQAYCLWLSLFECNQPPYRLPIEIEWEWAAGGKRGTTAEKVRNYPWSDEKGAPDSTLANFNRTIGATTRVGNYPDGATPEGLYDIAGNVWEWMDSNYIKNITTRALRGGSWYDNPYLLSCSARDISHPAGWDGAFGFRVVRSTHRSLPEILAI
jgi:formylglycine-generating enzyme required for sulfatase activity